MLQYLIIQLDDTSVSYCHYANRKEEHKLIGQDDLKAGILFAMKENISFSTKSIWTLGILIDSNTENSITFS